MGMAGVCSAHSCISQEHSAGDTAACSPRSFDVLHAQSASTATKLKLRLWERPSARDAKGYMIKLGTLRAAFSIETACLHALPARKNDATQQ